MLAALQLRLRPEVRPDCSVIVSWLCYLACSSALDTFLLGNNVSRSTQNLSCSVVNATEVRDLFGRVCQQHWNTGLLRGG